MEIIHLVCNLFKSKDSKLTEEAAGESSQGSTDQLKRAIDDLLGSGPDDSDGAVGDGDEDDDEVDEELDKLDKNEVGFPKKVLLYVILISPTERRVSLSMSR
jgi:hypothetical protein